MSAIAQRRTAAAAAITMLLAVLQYVLFVVNPAPANAAGPEPTYGSAVVDGDIGEWNLAADYFADMIKAGGNGGQTEVLGKAYLRYDCDTSNLYVLALSEGAFDGLGDAWVKIYELGNAEANTTEAAVGESGFETVVPNVAPGDYTIEIHFNNDGNTASNAKDGGPLTIACPDDQEPGTASVVLDMDCDYEKEATEVFVTSTNAVTYIDVDDDGVFEGSEAVVTGFVKVALPPGTIVEWQSVANDGFEFEGGATTVSGEFEVEDCTQKPASVFIDTYCDERTQTFEVFVTSTNAVTYIDVDGDGVLEGDEAIITGFVEIDLPPGTIVVWESFADEGASFEGEPTISGEFEVEDCGEPEPGIVLVGVSGSCVTEEDGSATGRLNVTINPDGGATVTVNGSDYTISESGIVVDADTTYGWTAVAADGYEIGGDASGSVVIEDCSEDDDNPPSRTPNPKDIESALGDLVWFDENQNGQQDGGDFEFPIAGATVELLTSDGTVLETQVTGEDGLYLFDELDAGNYRVRVCLEGAEFTLTNELGVADDVDSDVFTLADKAGCAMTGLINLGEGVTDLTWDAGIVLEVEGIQIEPTTTTAPTTTTIEPVTVETLPFTGFEVEDMALLGIGVLAAGSVLLLLIGRRDDEADGEVVSGWSNN